MLNCAFCISQAAEKSISFTNEIYIINYSSCFCCGDYCRGVRLQADTSQLPRQPHKAKVNDHCPGIQLFRCSEVKKGDFESSALNRVIILIDWSASAVRTSSGTFKCWRPLCTTCHPAYSTSLMTTLRLTLYRRVIRCSSTTKL